MASNGFQRPLPVGFGIALAEVGSFFEQKPARDVAIQRVVRGSLVGQDIRHDAALRELRNHVGAIADQPNRHGFFLANSVLQDAQRFIKRVDHEVAVASPQALLDALRINLHAEEAGAGHGRGEWLRSAHAAHAAAHNQLAG